MALLSKFALVLLASFSYFSFISLFSLFSLFSLSSFSKSNPLARNHREKISLELRVISLPFKQDLYLSNWDIDGNFTNLRENDRIIAQNKKRIILSNGVNLPAGVNFYGFISKIEEPKNFNRDGKIEISFYALEDLSGKVFQFKDLSNRTVSQDPSTFLSKSSKIGQSSLTAGIGGGLIGYQVASSALSFFLSPQFLFAGATSLTGAGLLVGFVGAVLSKGEKSFLKPGDDLLILLERDLILPVPTNKIDNRTNNRTKIKKVKQENQELKLEVLQQIVIEDDFGQKLLVLDLEIENRSSYLIGGSGFELANSYKSKIRPVSGVGLKKQYFQEDLSTQRIEPGEIKRGQLAFYLDLPGIEHFLTLKNYYQQKLVFSQSIGYPKEREQENRLTRLKKIFKNKFKRANF